MTIPVRMTLPEPLRRIQFQLMLHCPYNNQDGYACGTLCRLADHGFREELDAFFMYVITHATCTMDMEYVWFLRCIHPYDFDEVVPILTEECFRELEHRKHSDPLAFKRNPAFERVLIEEKLSDEVLRYMSYSTQPSHKLLHVLALRHRREADMIALRGMPNGALWGNRVLADNQSACDRILRTLHRYEAIFGHADTSRVAQRIISRYPCRHRLKTRIGKYLGAPKPRLRQFVWSDRERATSRKDGKPRKSAKHRREADSTGGGVRPALFAFPRNSQPPRTRH